MNTSKWVSCLLVTLLISFTGLSKAYAESSLKETVTPFAIPKGDAPDRMISLPSVSVSPDSQHISYVARNAGKFFAVKDGIAQKPYDDIAKGTPVFTPDSKNIVYGVRKGKKWCIVSGTQEMKWYQNTSAPVISMDSKRIAYVAAEDMSGKGKNFVVIDGKEDKRPFDGVLMKPFSLMFSPDSSRFSYIGVKNQKMVFVCDGKESKVYEYISSPTYSPDSKHVAFVALDSTRKAFMVVDGVESEKHDAVMLFLYSYDSKHLAYVVLDNKKWAVIVDGIKGPYYDNLSVPRFSPDGSKLAYTAQIKKDKSVLIVNNKQVGPEYDEFSYLSFSPDSLNVYIDARKGKKWHLVTNGVEGPAYDAISSPGYSPDGKRTAYVAKKDGRELIVLDGKEGPSYDGLIKPMFSPDSQRTFAIAKKNGKYIAIVDGKDGQGYDLITEPAFSPDSKHYAYMAKRKNTWLIVVDGKEIKDKFIGFIKGSNLTFRSNNKFTALGIRPGPNFVKLEVEIN